MGTSPLFSTRSTKKIITSFNGTITLIDAQTWLHRDSKHDDTYFDEANIVTDASWVLKRLEIACVE